MLAGGGGLVEGQTILQEQQVDFLRSFTMDEERMTIKAFNKEGVPEGFTIFFLTNLGC